MRRNVLFLLIGPVGEDEAADVFLLDSRSSISGVFSIGHESLLFLSITPRRASTVTASLTWCCIRTDTISRQRRWKAMTNTRVPRRVLSINSIDTIMSLLLRIFFVVTFHRSWSSSSFCSWSSSLSRRFSSFTPHAMERISPRCRRSKKNSNRWTRVWKFFCVITFFPSTNGDFSFTFKRISIDSKISLNRFTTSPTNWRRTSPPLHMTIEIKREQWPKDGWNNGSSHCWINRTNCWRRRITVSIWSRISNAYRIDWKPLSTVMEKNDHIKHQRRTVNSNGTIARNSQKIFVCQTNESSRHALWSISRGPISHGELHLPEHILVWNWNELFHGQIWWSVVANTLSGSSQGNEHFYLSLALVKPPFEFVVQHWAFLRSFGRKCSGSLLSYWRITCVFAPSINLDLFEFLHSPLLV